MLKSLLGSESGEVSTTSSEGKKVGESKITWECKEPIWEGIDWLVLQHEFHTLGAPWRERKFGDFLKSFLVSFIHLLASSWDLSTDAQLMYYYLHGDNYRVTTKECPTLIPYAWFLDHPPFFLENQK